MKEWPIRETLGAGIFDNDLSMDVRSYYGEFLEENENDHKKAYKELIKQYRDSMYDTCTYEKADAFFAAAEIRTENGVLFEEVKKKCTALLTNRNIFEMRGEDEDTFDERTKC